MSTYRPNFTNLRQIFSLSEQEHLSELSGRLPLSLLTDSSRNIEEIGIDFIYSSAQLEGNTYDRHDTQALLKIGQTAAGKLYSDAVMLVNLRDSYGFLLSCIDTPEPFDWKDFIKTTHSLIADKLLEKGSVGVVRRGSVNISGTEYTPLAKPENLNAELDWIIQVARKVENPFDRAVYLHNNLAYLQFFKDCNKRTARNCMALSLMREKIFPCVLNLDSYRDYSAAVISYYETGEYTLFKEYFIHAYENTVKKYEPKSDPEIIRDFSL